MALTDKLRGKFIVFDGPDGCGKSTQLDLLQEHLQKLGIPVVRGKDPGGTVVGERIRHVLLGHDLSCMDVRCETFLFMASRAQLAGELIEPALLAGKTVLCDRFISATCAYQAAAGYDAARVIEVGRYAIGQTWPDLTIVIDLDSDEGLHRTGKRAKQDAMESRPADFHRKVRANFLTLPEIYPRPVVVVDGAGEPAAVHRRILEAIERAAV